MGLSLPGGNAGSLLAGGSIFSPATILGSAGIANSLFNTYMQYQQNQYERDLQKKMFQREDNAIQRRVADLRMAGLSPVLAAGQGAGTGPVVNTHAPQSQMPDIVSLLRMENEFETSKVQRELMKAQQTNAIASAYNQTQQGKYAGANAWLKGIEAKNANETGNAGTSTYGKMFNDFFGGAKKATSPTKKEEIEIKQKNKAKSIPLRTKPEWMNQSDWEFYLQNHK